MSGSKLEEAMKVTASIATLLNQQRKRHALIRQLSDAENLKTESLRQKARAAALTDWTKVEITTSESSFLLGQDDWMLALSDRRLSKYRIKFDATTHQYKWSNAVSSHVNGSRRWAAAAPRFFRSSIGTAVLIAVTVASMLIATAGVMALISGSMALTISHLLGNTLGTKNQVTYGLYSLSGLMIVLGYGFLGVMSSNHIAGNSAGARLVERSQNVGAASPTELKLL